MKLKTTLFSDGDGVTQSVQLIKDVYLALRTNFSSINGQQDLSEDDLTNSQDEELTEADGQSDTEQLFYLRFDEIDFSSDDDESSDPTYVPDIYY